MTLKHEEIIAAIKAQDISQVQQLILKYGVNAQDDDDRTLLINAIIHRALPIAKFLLQSKANPNTIYHSRDSIMRLWTYKAAIHHAVENNDPEALELLLAYGADVNFNSGSGRTPFDIAYDGLRLGSMRDPLEVLAVLLENNASVANREDYSHLIYFAASQNSIRLLKAVKARDIDVHRPYHAKAWTSARHTSALHIAASRGHTDIVQYLISLGAKVNDFYEISVNKFQPPLHCAADFGHEETCRVLLENGADAGMRDRDKKTADQIAYERGYREIALLILSFDPTFDLVGKVNASSNGKQDFAMQYDGALEIHQTEKAAKLSVVENNRRLMFLFTCLSLHKNMSLIYAPIIPHFIVSIYNEYQRRISAVIQHNYDQQYGLIVHKPPHEILGVFMSILIKLSSVSGNMNYLGGILNRLLAITESIELSQHALGELSMHLEQSPSIDRTSYCGLSSAIPSPLNSARSHAEVMVAAGQVTEGNNIPQRPSVQALVLPGLYTQPSRQESLNDSIASFEVIHSPEGESDPDSVVTVAGCTPRG